MSIDDAYRRFLKLTEGDAAAAAILAVGVYTDKTDIVSGAVGDDKLITANEVADMLGMSMKTIRRMDSDTSHERDFPLPVRLRSPAGGRPLKRWRLSDVRHYGGLQRK
jgi:predicted DNA-binding transcriptional regulator AlpA